MIRKLLRKALLICLCLSLAVPMGVVSYASEKILYGYYVSPGDLDENVQKYVNSIYLSNDPDGWALYINNSYVGTKTGNPVTFSYAPNANTYYVFTFDTSTKKASSYYKNTKEETVVSVFTFSIVDAVQTVQFLSTPEAQVVTKEAVKSASGYFDFGTFSFTYKEKPVSFDLRVNSRTNKAIITRDGREYSYDLEGTGKYETVYCEDLVPAQELNMDYMASSLTKYGYSTAKSYDSTGRLYTDSEVDSALSNQRITLINNKTGLSTTVPLQTTITHWVRKNDTDSVGDGAYNEYTEKVRVVCQWGEDRCSSIRSSYGESGRPFAVYGDSTSFNYVSTDVVKTKQQQYNNISWPASSWSDAVSITELNNNLDKTYGIYQFRRASVDWGPWQGWELYSGSKVRMYSNSSDYQYETRTAYAYKTRSWNPWSTYVYTSCTPSENSVECQSALKYSQRTRSWGAWSGYTYTGTESLGCSDVASAVGATCDRESATRYAKQVGVYTAYGAWSGWSTSSCASTNLKNCESKTVYAWRSMGSWSSWEPTTLNVSCSTSYSSSGGAKGLSLLTKDCMTETQYRYKSRTLDGYDYSGWTDFKEKPSSYSSQCTTVSRQSSLCGVTRTYGSNQLSKYGSYQSDCMSVYGADSLCGYTYSGYSDGTSKHGAYQTQCSSSTKTSSLCGYKSCRVAACGVESTTYKSCRNSACGIESTTYKSCQNSACGVASTTYKSCRNSACGVESTTYKTCRTSACGVESTTYKSCKTSACGNESCQSVSCGCKTYKADKAKCGSTLGIAKRCAAAGCETYKTCAAASCGYKSCRAAACGVESTTYKSCAASACGVKSTTYKSCRTSACGVESTTYKSCRTSACGVDYYTYKSCRTSACGVESTTYKSCANSACGYASCTIYSCPTSATAKTCYLYSCPTSVTNKTCSLYNCPTTATARYTSWSSWSDWSTSSCSESNYRTCDSKVVNYKRTRDWGSWSDYEYSYGATSSTIDYKSQTQTRYQTRSLNWGDYSDYIYSSCVDSDTVNCKSATRYRVRYLGDWSGWSAYNLDSCTSGTLSECQSKTMYSKRTMGAWGSTLYGENSDGLYSYTACSDTATKQCYSQEQIRAKQREISGSYGSWMSSSVYSYDSNYAYQWRYNNGVITTSPEKGTSTAVGSGSMYVSDGTYGYKDVQTAVVARKTYPVDSRMTVSEISDLTRTIGTEAGEASYVSSYINNSANTDVNGNKYVSWDYWTNNTAVNQQAGQAAVNNFVNARRFIPFIFITRHYRATNAKFLIEGYDNESIASNATVKTTLEDTISGLTMHEDSRIIYEICELNPNDPSCRVVPETPPPEEPDFCEVHPDAEECFCVTYPMSRRCRAERTDSAVIYYNYLDPLENYEGNLPANWQGYDALVNEIKASDLSGSKIQVTLTYADLEAMRSWIERNGDKLGTCEMIKDFSYIFTDKDEDLTRWLNSSNGCRTR